MKLLAKQISVTLSVIVVFFAFVGFANAQTIEKVGSDIVVSGIIDNGDNCALVYDTLSESNEFQLEGLLRPNSTFNWPAGFSWQGPTQLTITPAFYNTKDVLIALMESNCNNYNITLADSRDRQFTNSAYFTQRQEFIYVVSPADRACLGYEQCASERLRLFLIAPEGATMASFTAPMTASVINGVQETGQNIWPLFVMAGIPLAFIIGLQMIVFTRRAVMFNTKKND